MASQEIQKEHKLIELLSTRAAQRKAALQQSPPQFPALLVSDFFGLRFCVPFLKLTLDYDCWHRDEQLAIYAYVSGQDLAQSYDNYIMQGGNGVQARWQMLHDMCMNMFVRIEDLKTSNQTIMHQIRKYSELEVHRILEFLKIAPSDFGRWLVMEAPAKQTRKDAYIGCLYITMRLSLFFKNILRNTDMWHRFENSVVTAICVQFPGHGGQWIENSRSKVHEIIKNYPARMTIPRIAYYCKISRGCFDSWLQYPSWNPSTQSNLAECENFLRVTIRLVALFINAQQIATSIETYLDTFPEKLEFCNRIEHFLNERAEHVYHVSLKKSPHDSVYRESSYKPV